MSFASLLDHTARVHRLIEVKDPQYKSISRTYTVPSGLEEVNCATTRKRTVIAQIPSGVTPIGDRVVYFDGDIGLNERDVIELLTGPDAPAVLEVTSVTVPRGHHTEARVDEFKGKLDEGGS